MRGLGVGLDGEYLVALSDAEWQALQRLKAVAREAGEDTQDLYAVLALVQLFLDARQVMDDLKALVARFEEETCELPGDEPYSKLGAGPTSAAEKEPESVRKVPVRGPREAGPRGDAGQGPRPTEGAGT